MAYGFRSFIGIGKESPWGTAVPISDYFEALSESLHSDLDRYDIKNIVGTVAEPDDAVGIERVTGNIVIPGLPTAMGYFLKAAMQQVSASVVLSGFLFTNKFTTALADFSVDTPVQPYTLEIFRDVVSSVLYDGCCLNTLQIGFAPNQPVNVNASWIGQGNAVSAVSTAAPPTYPGSPSKPFAFNTLSLGIGGSGTARIEQLTLKIDNQLDGIPALNASSQIAKIRRKGPQTIGMTGTIDFVDVAEYLDFVNQTERRWTMNLTAANSFALSFDIPRMVYTAFPLGIPGRQRLTVGFTSKAFYSPGSATAIDIRLTNTKSFY